MIASLPFYSLAVLLLCFTGALAPTTAANLLHHTSHHGNAARSPVQYDTLVPFLANPNSLHFEHKAAANRRRLGGTGSPPCQASGLCSLQQVKPFVGDVYPSDGLKSSLEARSYKKEIVVVGESRTNPAYQAYNEFRQLGMGHVLWIGKGPEECQRSAQILPELGCAWSSQDFKGNHKYLMDKVAYTARAARLGYNVLIIDTDAIVFRDPYVYLKSPPLKDINILTMRDGDGWVNCGVVYIQNAAPDGPAAHMIAEVIDRSLRWGENGTVMKTKSPPRHNGCWEQTLYGDALLSVVSGRPVFYLCWQGPMQQKQVEWREAHERLLNASELGVASYLNMTTLPWPEELRVAGSGIMADYQLHSGSIRVPNAKGVWPEELGGEAFDHPRGNISSDWLYQLQQDIMPLWPDPEDPAMEQQAAAKVERFAYLPVFLGMSWSIGGHTGWWNRDLVGPVAPQAIAHFVHVPGGATNKLTVRMANHHYNWTLAHMAKPLGGVFFASTHDNPLPRALAYSPTLETRQWASLEEYRTAVVALTRLALETNRTVVYPSVQCNCSWVSGDRVSRLPLVIDHGRYIPHGTWSDLRCMWAGYLLYDCQQAKHWPGGILPMEFEHYLTLVPKDQHATLEGLLGGSAPGPDGNPVASEAVAVGKLAASLEGSEVLRQAKLVFLDFVPHIDKQLSERHAAYKIEAKGEGCALLTRHGEAHE